MTAVGAPDAVLAGGGSGFAVWAESGPGLPAVRVYRQPAAQLPNWTERQWPSTTLRLTTMAPKAAVTPAYSHVLERRGETADPTNAPSPTS
jgi:hypothetical protein